MMRDLSVLVRLGVSLMLVAQMALIAPMVLRVWLTHQDGLTQAGLFQAAWTVSAQLVAVLLMAVGVDFYPRISAMIADRTGPGVLLDRQIRLHLATGGPVLLLAVGLAPWILTGLYARDFAPAAPLLQGLAAGSMARLVSSPLEAALTAAGRPRTVLAAGGAAMVVLLAGAVAGHARWGLAGIGAAYALAQLVHLALLALASARRTGPAPGPAILLWLAGLMLGALVLTRCPPLATVALAAVAAAPGLARIDGARSASRGQRRGQRFFGRTSTAGRRSSAAWNRLKVWLT